MSYKFARYLVDLDLGSVPELWAPVLVIGSGIAGLSAALAAAESRRVVLISKEELNETATNYAQGGIAAVLAADDSFDSHVKDTLAAGQGLCEREAVEVLVRDGAARCRELIEMGMEFDTEDGEIHFTMEGAHSSRRIMHCDGDATGRQLQKFLAARVRGHHNIQIYENHFVIDLLHENNVCYGALIQDSNYGRLLSIKSHATILASGGGGQVFRETTNPGCATGDGMAQAFRAGAVLRDMEFVQFHPTTLYLAGAPRFLISESVRGEGAYLINQHGQRFMQKYDERAELAPRDVVSQSIFKELHSRDEEVEIYLDLRHLGEEMINNRFPNIGRICSMYGIDIVHELIPVRPAVHYFMGGVKTNLEGETSVERLLAAGEVASTGVQGANRLASNSLLEGLVFGYRAGKQAVTYRELEYRPLKVERGLEEARLAPLNLSDMLQSLKALTWRHLGVFRDEKKLHEARKTIAFWGKYVFSEQFQARGGFEVQNMLTVAGLIAYSAFRRKESRGAHQRIDFPSEDAAAEHTELTIELLEEMASGGW